MNPKQKKLLTRIIVALVLFVAIEVAAQTGVLAAAFGTPGDVYAEFALFLIPYLIAGYDVIAGALRGLVHGHALDEDFLMTVATFGAFALVLFPDTDPAYKGADSIALLQEVGRVLARAGWAAGNIDATLLCQAPKLAPHIPAMRENLAAALGIPAEDVSVKATTEEKLGFTGSGEGIAAHSVCLLRRI